jgi:hypothetical protein
LLTDRSEIFVGHSNIHSKMEIENQQGDRV